MTLARTVRRAALAVSAGFVAYAWAPHALTLGCAWRGPRDRRRVALTFDDGPDPMWTPRVLELLDRAAVRATFFVIGRRASEAPEIVAAIAARGHEVGNHTWSHRNLWFTGPRETEAEIARCHELLGTLAGRPPRWFRPPWGMVNAAVFPALLRHRERCVFWSIQPEGLRPRSGDAQADYVLRHVRPGAIVDLHDAEGVAGAPARLVDALPAIIEGLRAGGYAFATVSELLRDRARPTAGARGT